MKITLENFKCYQNQTFDFGNKGISLLSGQSGKGKTTILTGIYFALFGSGTKLVSYGKTSCKVILEFDDIKIIRKKRPNHLIVNDTHEDDSGQEIINNKFGITFDVSGYIAQNAFNSFILMSPIEKLSFLEKFAFRDIDLAKIKQRCKSHINKTYEKFISISSQLEMTKNVLEKMKEPELIEFPIKCKERQIELCIKNENVKFKNCNNSIIRNKRNKQSLETELSDLRVLSASLESKEENLSKIDSSLKDTSKILETISKTYIGDDNLEEHEMILNNMIKQRELYILRDNINSGLKNLEEMRENEIQAFQTKINDINDILWKEFTKEELETNISETKEALEYSKKLHSLQEKLNNYKDINTELCEQQEKELEEFKNIINQKEIYECPSCSSKLNFINGSLILSENTGGVMSDKKINQEEIKELRQKLQTNKNKLSKKQQFETEIREILDIYDEEDLNLEDIKSDLEYLEKYYSEQISYENTKKKLENNLEKENFSSSYISYKKTIKNQEKEYEEKINQNIEYNEEYNEEELRNTINEQKNIKKELKQNYETKTKLIKEYDETMNIIQNIKEKHIEKYDGINIQEEIEKQISELNKIINEKQEELEKHQENLNKIEEWKKYKEELEKYNEWKNKLKELEQEEKTQKYKYSAATNLKEKILKAESISVLNIIDSINTHARVYLDSFFTDNPISVQLQSFKETKKDTKKETSKPSINVSIEYKGMEADLSMLSGGELSRVILAYTLALAEMFNTPLLLLDECTANLDQEHTSEVFDSIRSNFNGKLTIVIAHQIVNGTFDNIINLND